MFSAGGTALSESPLKLAVLVSDCLGCTGASLPSSVSGYLSERTDLAGELFGQAPSDTAIRDDEFSCTGPL